VHRIYRSLAEAFSRQPRVAPAMLAEGLAGPTMVRPAAKNIPEIEMPKLSQACGVFADNFVRAVAT
jgi:hypothetical protein